jgi:hypothetical protein
MEVSMNEEQQELVNRVTRSTVAVIDTVAGRGGFRGEELATIGQLRDQCVALIQMLESMESEQASNSED